MKIRVAFLFIVFITYGKGFSFSTIAVPDSARDLKFIGTPKRNLSIRLYTVNKFQNFRFHSGYSGIPATSFKPNERLGFGTGIFYKSMGVWLGISPTSFQTERDIKGTSKRIDLQLNQYGKKFMNDAYLQYYKSFYLENSKDFNLSEPSKPYLVRPDIRTLSMGINTHHIFNWKKFSARAAFIQSEYQKKSAGSVMLGGNFSIYMIEADSGLFPSAYAIPGSELELLKGHFITLGLSTGYMYNFVLGKWCLNLTLLGGPAILYKNYTLENGNTETQVRPSVRIHTRSALSYNTEHFFSGVSFVLDRFNLPLKETALQYQFGNLRLLAGYRIGKINSAKYRRR